MRAHCCKPYDRNIRPVIHTDNADVIVAVVSVREPVQ
jgi:hypothetical protein